MPLGAARLGFWFRPSTTPGEPDRTETKSNNVLIVYDLNSVLPNRYNTDVNPADIASVISARETALGFVPTTITSYASLAATDITNYAHIWDIGYDTQITNTVADQYKAYLQTGGAAFLLGENGRFAARNNTIDNFVTSYMGGGVVSVSDYVGSGSTDAVIANEFLLANNDNTIRFNAPGRFFNIGTGTVMAESSDGSHAVVWQTGSLTEAVTGAVCSVLDINFFVGFSLDINFIDNLSIVLNKK
jgi:hypothetical protein